MHGKAPFPWLPLFAAALLYLGLSLPASAEDPAAPVEESDGPHIALILPTKSKGLAGAAEVVRQGALAAEEKLGDDRTPKLRLYATGDRDEEALLAYREAAAHGAVGVIGPLTRGAIAKLAAYGKLEIPVLALNSLDEQKVPDNLYGLGLSIETEARQVAQLMQREGRKQPVVIEAEGTLPRRMREAFASEWKRVTGSAPAVIVLANEKDAVWKLKDSVAALNADALFLATDLKRARLMRPYIGSERPIYATSQVWGGKFGKVAGANIDLLGVKFVDMPWLLEPYQADVIGFRRTERPLGPDLERLYGLGIDAYRLSLLLMVSAPGAAIEMQGVTGTLKLSETRAFSRELISGEVGGQPRTPAPKPEPVAPAAPVAPATPAEPVPAAPAPQPAAEPAPTTN